MRDAIAALESALGELENARDGLPEDLQAELETIIRQARAVLESLEGTTDGSETTEGSDRADAPG